MTPSEKGSVPASGRFLPVAIRCYIAGALDLMVSTSALASGCRNDRQPLPESAKSECAHIVCRMTVCRSAQNQILTLFVAGHCVRSASLVTWINYSVLDASSNPT